MPPTIYPSSPWRHMVFMLASVGIAAASIWILVRETPGSATVVEDRVMGAAGVVFFGIGIIVFGMRALRRAPLLAITDDGVSQHGWPDIAWSDVDHVRIVRLQATGQSFIDIVLNDPEAYRRRMSGVKQGLARTNTAFGLGPAVIAAAVLGGRWPLPRVVEDMSKHHPSLNVL